MTRPWYNILGGRYPGSEPCFYDSAALPWTKVLEDNWEVMRDELIALMEARPAELRPYFINHAMSFPPRQWKTMGLSFWRFTMHANCRRCPETMRILKTIPGVTSCSLSILEPGANINPHQGDTDAIIRCHLGLVIPAGLPDCGFQVGPDIRAWEQGKALPFCDAQTHTAWNHSQARRLIMIVDVIRPEFLPKQNWVCAHVLASSVIQMTYQSAPFLNNWPGFVKRALYTAIRIAVHAYLPLQRRFR